MQYMSLNIRSLMPISPHYATTNHGKISHHQHVEIDSMIVPMYAHSILWGQYYICAQAMGIMDHRTGCDQGQ